MIVVDVLRQFLVGGSSDVVIVTLYSGRVYVCDMSAVLEYWNISARIAFPVFEMFDGLIQFLDGEKLRMLL